MRPAEVKMQGTSDFIQCEQLIRRIFNKDAPCLVAQCPLVCVLKQSQVPKASLAHGMLRLLLWGLPTTTLSREVPGVRDLATNNKRFSRFLTACADNRDIKPRRTSPKSLEILGFPKQHNWKISELPHSTCPRPSSVGF